ncbi:MAG: DMT family transporter [Rhodobacteraceae bacterium]|nr:DMT family transporter [Paracoccaceae bacterium]
MPRYFIPLSQPARGHLAMLGFSFGIAGSFSLGGLVATLISPVALTASRFALAAIIIGVVAGLNLRLSRQHFQGSWRYCVGGMLMSVYFVLMFIALKTASPVSVSTVFTLTPLLSGVFGWLLLRQVMSRSSILALGIGALGAVWVIFRGDLDAMLSLRIGTGELIFFLGCVSHALYTPFVRKVNRGEPVQVFVFGMLVSGAILLGLFGWHDVAETPWTILPGIVWIAIAYLTIIATVLTFLAVSYASLRLPAAKVMAYTYLTPSWVLVWEAALGHGWPDGKIAIGLVAIVIALLMLLRHEPG